MDLLQRELERKKQTLAKAKASSSSNRKRKFLRQRDLRRLEEEEEEERLKQQHEEALRKKRAKIEAETDAAKEAAATVTNVKKQGDKKSNQQQQQKSSLKKKKDDGKHDASAAATSSNDKKKTTTTTSAAASSSASSIKDVTQQLRALGLPIRFFGETQAQRVARLEQASEQQTNILQGLSEKEEFRLGKGHGIRNTFLDRDDDDNNKDDTIHHHHHHQFGNNNNNNNNKNDANDGKTKKQKKEDDQDENDDDNLNGEKDPPKFIYKYLKGLLKEWEQDLADRPDIEARSVVGRNDTKTLKQCKDYIRPLFKLLKQRKLEPTMQLHLLNIVTYAKQGEFVKAHDTYMDMAIGRAAWPIGVTMVGIHARSGRAKIESSNVAHVMNSELQRKYLTSVKRLLSFAQKKRPDVDPSKKVS